MKERRGVVVRDQEMIVAHLVVEVVVEAVMDHIVMEQVMEWSHCVNIVVDFVVVMMDRNGEMRYQTMVIKNWLKEAVIL